MIKGMFAWTLSLFYTWASSDRRIWNFIRDVICCCEHYTQSWLSYPFSPGSRHRNNNGHICRSLLLAIQGPAHALLAWTDVGVKPLVLAAALCWCFCSPAFRPLATLSTYVPCDEFARAWELGNKVPIYSQKGPHGPRVQSWTCLGTGNMLSWPFRAGSLALIWHSITEYTRYAWSCDVLGTGGHGKMNLWTLIALATWPFSTRSEKSYSLIED